MNGKERLLQMAVPNKFAALAHLPPSRLPPPGQNLPGNSRVPSQFANVERWCNDDNNADGKDKKKNTKKRRRRRGRRRRGGRGRAGTIAAKRARQSQSPESVAPNVRVRNPIGQRSVTGEHSTGCRETRKRRQRVSHPSEAGRRIKEPGGKQKVNNKESVSPESYLSIHLSIYLSIHLLRNPCHGNMEKRNVNNKESLKKP